MNTRVYMMIEESVLFCRWSWLEPNIALSGSSHLIRSLYIYLNLNCLYLFPREFINGVVPRSGLRWNYYYHNTLSNASAVRYAKLGVVHAPGIPGTFSPPLLVSDPDMHHGTCFTHVPWCMSGSLTSGFLWSRWWGKRSRHSWRMRNTQCCVFGKRLMVGSVWAYNYYSLIVYDVLLKVNILNSTAV